MKITEKWLDEKKACESGKTWLLAQTERNGKKVIKKLIAEGKLDWATWTIVRIMTRPQYLQYAIFAAEQVLPIFEKKYPADKRPRQAIEAARVALENDTIKNRRAAAAAGWAAAAAGWSEMKIKILHYGLSLLEAK